MTYAVNRHKVEISQNIKQFQEDINNKYIIISTIVKGSNMLP